MLLILLICTENCKLNILPFMSLSVPLVSLICKQHIARSLYSNSILSTPFLLTRPFFETLGINNNGYQKEPYNKNDGSY